MHTQSTVPSSPLANYTQLEVTFRSNPQIKRNVGY